MKNLKYRLYDSQFGIVKVNSKLQHLKVRGEFFRCKKMTNPDNITITTFYLDMASDQCGYPVCCPGNQPKFVEVSFFPSQVSEIEDDLRKLFEDAKEVFHETGMPMFPCLLHHFCLPFSPICAMFYCMSQRKSRLDELIQSFNHGIGMFGFKIYILFPLESQVIPNFIGMFLVIVRKNSF